MRRYAGDAAQQVIVIGGPGSPAPPNRRGLRRRPPVAAPVAMTRATVVAADPMDPERAPGWLARDAPGTVDGALAVLNRALHARRIAAADPYGGELTRGHALVTRVGYGSGEEVADGCWTAARELPAAPAAVAREGALRPHERFAALLAARDAALASELLALRARADLEQAREREAALQLEAALGAARSELEGWRELAGMPARLEELRGLAPGAAALAAKARQGGLDDTDRAALARSLERLEAALRARTSAATF